MLTWAWLRSCEARGGRGRAHMVSETLRQPAALCPPSRKMLSMPTNSLHTFWWSFGVQVSVPTSMRKRWLGKWGEARRVPPRMRQLPAATRPVRPE